MEREDDGVGGTDLSQASSSSGAAVGTPGHPPSPAAHSLCPPRPPRPRPGALVGAGALRKAGAGSCPLRRPPCHWVLALRTWGPCDVWAAGPALLCSGSGLGLLWRGGGGWQGPKQAGTSAPLHPGALGLSSRLWQCPQPQEDASASPPFQGTPRPADLQAGPSLLSFLLPTFWVHFCNYSF